MWRGCFVSAKPVPSRTSSFAGEPWLGWRRGGAPRRTTAWGSPSPCKESWSLSHPLPGAFWRRVSTRVIQGTCSTGPRWAEGGTLVMFCSLLFPLWVSWLFLFIFSSKVAYTSGPQIFIYQQLYLYTFLVRRGSNSFSRGGGKG